MQFKLLTFVTAITSVASAIPVPADGNIQVNEVLNNYDFSNYTLLAVPNDKINAIMDILGDDGVQWDVLYEGTDYGNNPTLVGIQKKSFASVMQNIVNPILASGASIIAAIA